MAQAGAACRRGVHSLTQQGLHTFPAAVHQPSRLEPGNCSDSQTEALAQPTPLKKGRAWPYPGEKSVLHWREWVLLHPLQGREWV